MRTEDILKARLAEVEADGRLHYPPADVRIDAPLALDQLCMETEAATLRWVLNMGPFIRGERYVYES
jgi:hypothetical protein